jgi:hypothetical protein
MRIDVLGRGAAARAWTFDTGKPIKARRGRRRRGLRRSDQRLPAQARQEERRRRWRAQVDTATPPRLPGTDEKSRWVPLRLERRRRRRAALRRQPRPEPHALDVASRRELWRVAHGDIMTATPGAGATCLLFAEFAGKVQAVDAKDGKPALELRRALPVAGDLVVDDAGRVFVGSRTYDLIALDAGDRQGAVEALLLVLLDRVAAGGARPDRLHRLVRRRRRLRDRRRHRRARAGRRACPAAAWARTPSTSAWSVAGTVGYGAWPGCAQRLAGRHRPAERRRCAGCTSIRRRPRSSRRRRNGASPPRPLLVRRHRLRTPIWPAASWRSTVRQPRRRVFPDHGPAIDPIILARPQARGERDRQGSFDDQDMARGLAATLGLAPLGASPPQQQGVSKNEIVVGSIQDLSGPDRRLRQAGAAGMLLRVDEINEQGGINGRKLKLLVEDSAYDPKKAVLAAQKLVNQDKIFIMAGHIGTAQNLAAMPVQFEKNVVNFFPVTAAREMYEPLNRLKYSFAATYYDQMRTALPKLVKEKGAKKVCTIYQDDEFGLEVVRGGEAGLKAVGMEFAEKTSFKRGATDFLVAGGAHEGGRV